MQGRTSSDIQLLLYLPLDKQRFNMNLPSIEKFPSFGKPTSSSSYRIALLLTIIFFLDPILSHLARYAHHVLTRQKINLAIF